MKHSLFMGIMIIFTLAMVGAVQGSLTDGLVLYMPFNQSSSNTTFTRDYSGQNNNGTVIGATLTSNHNSYNFVSAGQYIDFGNPSSLNFNNVSFTLSAWIKSTGTDPANGDTILGKRASNGARGYELRLKASGALRLSLREEGGSEKTYETFTTLDKDTWYYVTVVIDQPNNDVLYYIDGKYDRTVSCTNCQTNIGSYGDSFIIGAYGYTGISWNGSLDNIRVYNKLMDATNISLLYSEGHGDNLYISNTGSDSNNGLSEATPLKTISSLNSITNIPGDILSFKSGDFWSERLYFYNESGNKDFPITINSYGSGKIPEIGGRFNLYNTSLANWTLEYYNVYSTQTNTIPYRVWLSGIEYSESVNNNSVNNYDRWYYDSVNDKLYIYATQNPANEYTSFKGVEGVNDFFSSIYIELSDYLIFNNINITGNTPGVYIEGGQNNIFDNVYLGYYSMYSFVTYADIPTYRLSINNSIINSYIDSGYDLKNNYSFNGNDAIKLNEGTNHTIIENNTIIGFGHAGVYIEGISNSANYVEGSSYNIVKNNSIYFNQLTYGRCFGIDGNESQTKNNNITGNRCYNSTIRDQINGNNNEYSYNIISIKNNTEKYTDSKSQGIDFETYSSGVSHDNLIDHNTIYQTCDAGISTRDTVDTPHNHTITNNIIYNSGYCSRSYSDISVFVEVNAGLDYNYSNNLIYKTDLITDTIDYRGTIYNVANWNSADAGGDDIKDNLYTDPLFVGNTLYPNLNTYASNMSTTGSYVGALEPVACIDSDGDGFNSSVLNPACGTAIQLDCDDTNSSVLPAYDDMSPTTSIKICPGTYNLGDEGNTGIIYPSASNIIIDGNGAEIISNETGIYFASASCENVTIKNFILTGNGLENGIFPNGRKNQTIINNTIRGFSKGIFYLTHYGKIEDNNIENNTAYGIWHQGNETIIKNNYLYNSSTYLMYAKTSNYLTIDNNIIKKSARGIVFETVKYSNVSNNNVTNMTNSLIESASASGTYNNNYFNNYGYQTRNCYDSNGYNEHYFNNSCYQYYHSAFDCNTQYCDNNIVYNNYFQTTVSDLRSTIFIQDNENHTVYNNTIITNGAGIQEDSTSGKKSYNNTFEDNIVSATYNYCLFAKGNNTLFKGNDLSGCITNEKTKVVNGGYNNYKLTFTNNIANSFFTIYENMNVIINSTPSVLKVNLSNGGVWILNHTGRKDKRIEGNKLISPSIESDGYLIGAETITTTTENCTIPFGGLDMDEDMIMCDGFPFFNITSSITIGASNININGQGSTLFGKTTLDCIESASNRVGVVFENFTIRNCKKGIDIWSDDSSIYRNLILRDNTEFGIRVQGTENTVFDNITTNNTGTGYGMFVKTTDYINITNSYFTNARYGIYTLTTDNTWVNNSYFIDHVFNALYFNTNSNHILFENNVVYNTSQFMVRINFTENSIFRFNVLNFTNDDIIFEVENATDTVFHNNIGDQVGWNYFDIGGDNITIYDNYGRDVFHNYLDTLPVANRTVMSNSWFYNNTGYNISQNAVYMTHGISNNIENNTFTLINNSGFAIEGDSRFLINNNFTGNIINNSRRGVFTGSTNSIFKQNTFDDVVVHGVGGWWGDCTQWDNSQFINNNYVSGEIEYYTINAALCQKNINIIIDEPSAIQHRINISGSYAIFRYNGDKNLQVEGTEITSNGDLVVNDEFTLICDTYLKLQNNWKFNNVYLQDSCNIYIESGGSLNG